MLLQGSRLCTLPRDSRRGFLWATPCIVCEAPQNNRQRPPLPRLPTPPQSGSRLFHILHSLPQPSVCPMVSVGPPRVAQTASPTPVALTPTPTPICPRHLNSEQCAHGIHILEPSTCSTLFFRLHRWWRRSMDVACTFCVHQEQRLPWHP